MIYKILDFMGRREATACNFHLLSEGRLHPGRVLPDTHDLLYILEGGWEVVQDGRSYLLEG